MKVGPPPLHVLFLQHGLLHRVRLRCSYRLQESPGMSYASAVYKYPPRCWNFAFYRSSHSVVIVFANEITGNFPGRSSIERFVQHTLTGSTITKEIETLSVPLYFSANASPAPVPICYLQYRDHRKHLCKKCMPPLAGTAGSFAI